MRSLRETGRSSLSRAVSWRVACLVAWPARACVSCLRGDVRRRRERVFGDLGAWMLMLCACVRVHVCAWALVIGCGMCHRGAVAARWRRAWRRGCVCDEQEFHGWGDCGWGRPGCGSYEWGWGYLYRGNWRYWRHDRISYEAKCKADRCKNCESFKSGTPDCGKSTPATGTTIEHGDLNAGTYSLKGGRDGKYCADEYHNVVCSSDTVGDREKFTLEKRPDGKYALKGGLNGKYCADDADKVRCNRDAVGGYESFTIEKAPGSDGTYALKGGRDGKYCAQEADRVICDREAVGDWERFTMKAA